MNELKYTKILVPHAGTKAGNIALEHAIEIAKKFSSTITLLHVEMPVPSSYFARIVEEEKEEFRGRTKEIVDSIKKKTKELEVESKLNNGDVKVDFQVIAGDPANEIINYAKENKFELIIIPRRRLTGIKSILKLGSVSRKVIEHACCPVLIIDEF